MAWWRAGNTYSTWKRVTGLSWNGCRASSRRALVRKGVSNVKQQHKCIYKKIIKQQQQQRPYRRSKSWVKYQRKNWNKWQYMGRVWDRKQEVIRQETCSDETKCGHVTGIITSGCLSGQTNQINALIGILTTATLSTFIILNIFYITGNTDWNKGVKTVRCSFTIHTFVNVTNSCLHLTSPTQIIAYSALQVISHFSFINSSYFYLDT